MHASNLDAKSANAQEEREEQKSTTAASPAAVKPHLQSQVHRRRPMRRRGEEQRKKNRENKKSRANPRCEARKGRRRKRGNLTAVSRRTVAAPCVGGVGALVRAAAAQCVEMSGVAVPCALEKKKKAERNGAERGKDCPPSPIYLRRRRSWARLFCARSS